MKATDPVCKMTVDEKNVAATSLCTAAVFDKTGILTKGEPEVTEIVSVDGAAEGAEGELLRLAAIAEKGSEHPLAEAIIKRADMLWVAVPEAEQFEAISGYGVKVISEGKEIFIGNRRLMTKIGINVEDSEKTISELEEKGNTIVIVAVEGKLMGFIAVADTFFGHLNPMIAAAAMALSSLSVVSNSALQKYLKYNGTKLYCVLVFSACSS